MNTKTKTKIKPKSELCQRPKNLPAKKPRGRSAAQSLSKEKKDEEAQLRRAKYFLSPSTPAAITTSAFLGPCGEVDLYALMDTLDESMKRVQGGDLQEVESMLMGQAHSLQSIFTHLAYRSTRTNMVKHIELDLRLALKAQAQCCRTLEVLAAMKNPPVVLARQANVTTGPQQINNNTGPISVSPACEGEKIFQNELKDGQL